MIWKVLYDFSRPNWQTFGHVLFIEARSDAEAELLGRQAAQRQEDGATIARVDVTRSNKDARARHEARVERKRLWLANVAHGVANARSL